MCPLFLKFQKSIPPRCRCIQILGCLTATTEENLETLVLDNLNCQGFVNEYLRKPLERDQMEHIFKVYGHFHAISFAYKALHSAELSELTKTLSDACDAMLLSKTFQYRIKLVHQQCFAILQSEQNNAVMQVCKNYLH